MAVSTADSIDRMQDDLKRALGATKWKNKWVMVIDRKKCVGCNACTVACKSENVTPPGVAYNVVWEEEIGEYPNVRRRFTPRPCMQCRKAPCVEVCPVKATFNDDEGIVEINYNNCIGCRYCINACPYGARGFDYGEFYTDNTPKAEDYEKRANFEYQILWPRERKLFSAKSPVGNARKCHFCIHRIKEALLPACIVTCIGRARYFGDINDKNSLVAGLISRYKASRLKEELGTEPSVYYLD